MWRANINESIDVPYSRLDLMNRPFRALDIYRLCKLCVMSTIAWRQSKLTFLLFIVLEITHEFLRCAKALRKEIGRPCGRTRQRNIFWSRWGFLWVILGLFPTLEAALLHDSSISSFSSNSVTWLNTALQMYSSYFHSETKYYTTKRVDGSSGGMKVEREDCSFLTDCSIRSDELSRVGGDSWYHQLIKSTPAKQEREVDKSSNLTFLE